MSSPFATQTKPELQAVDLARLIPGAGPGRIGNRKPPQAVRLGSEFTPGSIAPISAGSTQPLWAPAGLAGTGSIAQSDGLEMGHVNGSRFLTDRAELVAAWGCAGTTPRAVPTHSIVRVRGRSAILPARPCAVACGLDHADGIHRRVVLRGNDLRLQARILGKSILGATAVPCFAYGLQGAWSTSALFCAAGLLHFGALSDVAVAKRQAATRAAELRRCAQRPDCRSRRRRTQCCRVLRGAS